MSGYDRYLRIPDDWNRRLCRGNDSAERRARALALEHSWALAFSRTGNPATGEFGHAVILARFGEVDLNSLGR